MGEQNELFTAAMQVILHARNAHNAANEALGEAKRFNFQEAAPHSQKAGETIILAHKSQTDITQERADGYGYEPSLLFTRARDTLMTIKSELHLSRQLIDVLRIIKNNK